MGFVVDEVLQTERGPIWTVLRMKRTTNNIRWVATVLPSGLRICPDTRQYPARNAVPGANQAQVWYGWNDHYVCLYMASERSASHLSHQGAACDSLLNGCIEERALRCCSVARLCAYGNCFRLTDSCQALFSELSTASSDRHRLAALPLYWV